MERRELVASLVAGGCAGMCVDLTLYPLDTLKTRLQSQQGFYKAGGFRGIYAGVPSAAVGSFPNAAAFFVTYECTKSLLGAGGAGHVAPVTHMLAASLGEVVACLIRVPTEVVKQRTQAAPSSSTRRMLLATLTEEGVRGLYRGYGSTVLRELGYISFSSLQAPVHPFLRFLHQVVFAEEKTDMKRLRGYDRLLRLVRHGLLRAACVARLKVRKKKNQRAASIPFSLVQFPLWEYLKTLWSRRQGHTLSSWQAAVCGAFAGAIAAFVTTPLDVAKTRIMLAKAGSTTARGNIPLVLHGVWRSQGLSGLFAGSIPRTAFISVGGFIFLGAYEEARRSLMTVPGP
ncbi:mitochondrial S-adenosylmethionine carrier protein isoform X1 [Pseudoliparis swirei]|uniref:mitochondrial S-adenosylmethionine carrier protein isoform X1 n=1 Tax=Pseudoliparis swirei TaxID=2059687 RepID=UPI0024BE4358|nr:mitochondrial S-adenosylmethionine carrier protein isoform X1 [Pseudoliparis swirei]